MKHIIRILLLSLIILSCQKEDVEPQQSEPQPDCNCDRVVVVNTFNLPSGPFWTYTTINDCTGVQKSGTKYTEVNLNDCI